MYRFKDIGRILCIIVLCSCMSVGLFCSSSDNSNSSEGRSPEEMAGYLVGSVIEVLDSLPKISERDSLFFEENGIPPDLHHHFVVIYSYVRTNLNHVLLSYRKLRSVRFFLINRYLQQINDTLVQRIEITHRASGDNPVFMAFSLYVEGLPDVQSIGSPTYIKTLARSFGTLTTEVTEGVWTLLIHHPTQLLEAVAQMIHYNLDSGGTAAPVFFFDNIIVPYLTYISKGYQLHAPIEEKVFSGFIKVFNSRDTINDLCAFTNAFKKYLTGASLNIRYINNLNETLEKHNLRLFVRHKTCIGYHILDTRIPIGFEGIGKVILLEKANIALSASFLGLSTIREADVILTVNDIADVTDDIRYALDKGTALTPIRNLKGLTSPDGKAETNPDSLTAWHATLLQKEFAGLSHGDITIRLIRQIAVHEVKHKWDEVIGADSNWYTLDCEISAHLAECIHGGIPFYSLLLLQNRLARFYINISEVSVRSMLRSKIRTCWSLTRRTAADSLDAGALKRELKRMYAEYTTIGGDTLPSLKRFYEKVVKVDLEPFPEVTYGQ
jgi:hypothetical protein